MENRLFSVQYSLDVVKQHCALKNIHNNASKEAMIRNIRKFCNVLVTNAFIDHAKTEKYKFLVLWNNLKSHAKLIQRNSTQRSNIYDWFS
jgi:hypothetical protein